MNDSDNTIPSSGREVATHPSRLRTFGLSVLAVLLYLALSDAAVETFVGHSPLRWIIVGTVAAYLALSALLWRKLSWTTKASVSFFVLFGLMAFASWRPEGSDSPLTILRQPTSTLLSAATILGILLAGWILAQLKFLPWPARGALVLLAVYGVAAFVVGIMARTPYAALLHGGSLWEKLPFWLQGGFLGAVIVLPAALFLQIVTAIARIRAGQMHEWGRQALALAMCLGIAGAGMMGPRSSTPTGERHGLAPAQFASWKQPEGNGTGPAGSAAVSPASPVSRTFELTHVDPAYFAVALGKDPSKIFAFVRDQIAYESYSGCLRGPRGTLMAMAGNSIDRAALLASLLEHSGQRVRYARGPLPEALAQQLVDSMWVERKQAAPDKTEGKPSPEIEAAAERLIDAVKRDGTLLRDTLKKAGYPTSQASAVTPELLTKEAQEHYWVQWWQHDAWVDLDPSFATATPGQVFARAEETFDVLPEAIFHRVGIRIRLEEYSGDKPSSREILEYAAKAADLSGVDLLLTHQLEKGENQGNGYLSPFSSSAQGTGQVGQMKPVLIVGKAQSAGQPFWQKAPAQNAGGAVTDIMGGGETTASVPVATAEFLDFDFIAPDGRIESVEREIFDLVGKARRLKGQALNAGEVASRTQANDPDNLTAVFYDLFITTGSIDAAHLRNLADPPGPAEGDPVNVGAGLLRINIAFAALSDALLSRMGNAQGLVCRFYIDSPRVQIAELSRKSGVLRLTLDLRRDQARAVAHGLRPDQLFYAQVLRGVVDGTLERTVIDYFAGSSPGKESPGPRVISTSLMFEQARATNTPTVLLVRDSTALGSEVSEDSRALIDEALAAGHLVLAPKTPVRLSGVPRLAWWQVDSRSGSTIAVTDEALHQAQVEYHIIKEDRSALVYIKFTGGPDPGIYVARFADPHMAAEFVAAVHDVLGNIFVRGVNEFVLLGF
jgi:hypothetical protein